MDNILLAFALTLIAGLCTGIGGFIALFAKSTNKTFLSVSLGFSAGVMIYVSMIEIFPKAVEFLSVQMGEKLGSIWTVVAFFGGMLLIALIDKLIPSAENPHEITNTDKPDAKNKKLMRMGILTAFAIGIHNFPEGLATFVSALQEPSVAIPIVVAIAMHNIPEGMAVAVPIYHSTGSRKKAFFYSLLSGLSEPVGALIGYLVLMPFLNDAMFGIIFAAVAGIMVFISIDGLLPSAREYGKHHHSIYGFVAGMMLMAISLLMFI